MTPKKLLLGLLNVLPVLQSLADLKPTSATTLPVANPEANLIAEGTPGVSDVVGPLSNIPQLVKDIDDLVYSSENREGFVRGLMEEVLADAKKYGYNVMVFNLNQEYETDIHNTVGFFDVVGYDGIPYGIWVFHTGTFTSKGDG
jgi:hypothetical protein